jgi:tRNA pseudouridine55 synthase
MNKNIYGALNINKPSGITSHDVVEQVRKLLKTRKVGHTGTLDPAASGVLPICVGKATRLSQYLLEADKEYRLVAKLGETTDTQDANGRLLEMRDWQGITRQDILQAIQGFIGEIDQIPPMYSACKYNGKRLYKLAREGQWVERKPRRVAIHRLTLVSTQLPLITLEASCSKGTYMRTLCADLGEVLGCGAYLYELVRTRCGQFTIDQAVSLDELRQAIEAGRLGEVLYTLDQMLAHLPAVTVNGESAKRAALGSPVLAGGILTYPPETINQNTKVRLYNPAGRLLAIAESSLKLDESPEGHKVAFWPKRVLV